MFFFQQNIEKNKFCSTFILNESQKRDIKKNWNCKYLNNMKYFKQLKFNILKYVLSKKRYIIIQKYIMSMAFF